MCWRGRRKGPVIIIIVIIVNARVETCFVSQTREVGPMDRSTDEGDWRVGKDRREGGRRTGGMEGREEGERGGKVASP